MKCEIIKDLLPSYIDDLTSSESNMEIEEHLKDCSQCKECLEQMKAEVKAENPRYDKAKIKPFKKLNRRIFYSVLITLGVCILVTGVYFYFFEIGWKADSKDMNVEYSYQNGTLTIDFELTDGRVLTPWIIRNKKITGPAAEISFRECYSSILDDRGKYPNQFSWGIGYMDEKGNVMKFSEDDFIILHFKDKTETIYLQDIVKELSI